MLKIGFLSFILVFLFFTSCSTYFNAYIRNTTDGTATVDVYLLNKKDLKMLPNKVKVGRQVVAFKSGYRKHIDSLQNVIWVDVNRFKLELAPKTTVDLTDMVGRVLNGSIIQDVLVTVSVANRTDTIINRGGQTYQQFEYKSMGFGTPILYHDIK